MKRLILICSLIFAACSEPSNVDDYMQNKAVLYKKGAQCYILSLGLAKDLKDELANKSTKMSIKAKQKKLNCKIVMKAGLLLFDERKAYFYANKAKAAKVKLLCKQKEKELKTQANGSQASYDELVKSWILNDPKTVLDCFASKV